MLRIKVSNMRLASRKEIILAAVVESYILTGEPVGSKALQAEFEMNISSATIRNELAELTANGFLAQPHTSAGRIPTDAGYRYYVDNLLKSKKLSRSAKERISAQMGNNPESPESILKTASELIAEVTSAVALSTTPDGRSARVHKVSFIPIGRHTAMAVLVTSTGMVKTGLFRCEFVITPEMLRVFDNALNKQLSGLPLIELTQPFIQTLAASFGELALFMPNVLSVIQELASSAAVSSVEINGRINLLYMPELGLESGINVLRFLNGGKAARFLMDKCRDSTVLIGTETGIRELSCISVVMSRYEVSGSKAGVIAALGPKRIDYSALIALVEYTAEVSSKLIDELITED